VPDPAADTLRELINGYQVSQALHVAATLGLADLLEDGPRDADDLAAETGTHAPSLYRLMRALAAAGVFQEDDERRFALTEVGAHLRSDAPGSQRGWAAFIGRPYQFATWSNLLYSVRTGENAFGHVHGTGAWEYRSQHPEESAIFDAAMTSVTGRTNAAVLEAYDFGGFGTVVDVGGSRAVLLAALLSKYPEMRGVLFDLPHVVAGAPEVLERAAVADRCTVVGGSFFDDDVPEGGDAYLLKAIVHDWDDEPATEILRACRRAMRPDAKVLVLERILAPPNEGADAKFSDLNMLVSLSGRERTEAEFEALLAAGGYRLDRVVRSDSHVAVIEGPPAG
jgi:O-methyltransferase domain/Dimerisation domain